MQSDQITPPCAQGPHSAACSEVSDGPSSGSRKRPACTLSSSVASINAENRRRRLEGTDTPLARATPSTPPADFIPFGTGMQLPWLPYAFTQTCALCGKTGIQPDTKRLMPLTFLQEFLRRTCARTPFVYNVLYQMAHHPHLEEQEARKWRKMMGRPVPLHLRGRICTCLQCSRPVNDRASSRASRRYISDPPAVGDSSAPEGARPAHQGAAPPPPAAWNARGNAGEDGGDDGVMPLAEAMLASYNADYDDWSIVLGDRITQQQQPFQAGLQGECGAQASYMGEVSCSFPQDVIGKARSYAKGEEGSPCATAF